MKNTKIFAVIIILIAIVGLIWFFAKGPSGQQVSNLPAVDTAGDFYHQWLKALQEPESADPNLATLANSPILSEALKTRIMNAQKDSSATTDPVLCQTEVPENISMRNIFEGEEEVQVLVTSKDKSVTNQSLMTLKKHNDGWYINDIECSSGEFAPEDKEFSFEKEGYLLKGSIPEPYDPENWHLVFEEDGVPGHVVPLLFDSESQCIDLDGNTSTCELDTFVEATKVFVQSQMTEAGAEVKNLRFEK